MISRERVLTLLVTTTAICANEILRIFVKGDIVSAVLFGVLSLTMLIVFLKQDRDS